MTSLLTTPLLLLAAFAPATVAQRPEAQPLTEDQRALFALLDEFDPLDTSKLLFVRCELDLGDDDGEQWGFLLREDDQQFVLRQLPGSRNLLVARTRSRSDELVGSYVTEELGHFERSLLEEGARLDSGSRATDLVELARAYARRGDLAAVHRLWKSLGTLQALRTQLARVLADRLVDDFADPAFSWRDLQQRHESWLREFAGERAERSVAPRLAWIAEFLAERERRDATDEPPTPADLVFDLHDEFWFPNFTMTMEVPPPSPPPDTPTRLQRVKSRGLECVPALIAALADDSPTRVVRGDVEQRFVHQRIPVARFGYVVELTLIEIAGFTPQLDRSDRLARIDDRRLAWQQWFEAAQKSSPAALLDERIALLDPEAIQHALVDHRDRLPRVLEALGKAPRSDARRLATSVAIRALGMPLPDAMVTFVANEFAAERDVPVRTALAETLYQHGHHEVVPVIAEAWRSHVDRGAPSSDFDPVGFLARCDDRDAWLELEAGCATPVGRKSLTFFLAMESDRSLRQLASRSSAAALRRCLDLAAVDESIARRDVTVRVGRGSFDLNFATTADFASIVRARCWPDEFGFDPLQTYSVRRARRDVRTGPNETADKPPEPAALARVDLGSAAPFLPAHALAAFRAFETEPVTGARVIAACQLAADAVPGRSVVFEYESTGRGGPSSIRVSVEETTIGAMFRGGFGSNAGMYMSVVTRLGKTTGRSSAPVDDLERAFRLPIGEPVEVTFAAGTR